MKKLKEQLEKIGLEYVNSIEVERDTIYMDEMKIDPLVRTHNFLPKEKLSYEELLELEREFYKLDIEYCDLAVFRGVFEVKQNLRKITYN